MTVMTGALYPQRPGALSRGAYSFRNGGWADLATALGMGILSADGQNVTLPQGIAAGLQNFQQTSRDRQQEQRQAWLDDMTQQQFDLTKGEAQARAEERAAETARRDRVRALLTGGPAIPIGEGGPAGGQFTTPKGPNLAGDLGLPPAIALALAEEGDPGSFANLFVNKKKMDIDQENRVEDRKLKQMEFESDQEFRRRQLGLAAEDNAIARQRLSLEGMKAGAESTEKQRGENLKNENVLRDEFNNLTKNFRTVQDAYNKITKSASSGTGAGDMAMLYAFVKLNDPESVVRESEFATMAQAGSLGERMQGMVMRVISGERLPDTVRSELTREARNMYDAQKQSYGVIKDRYKGLSERAKVDPENVVIEYATDVGQAGADQKSLRGAGTMESPVVLSPDSGEQEYDALPPGAVYVAPDGTRRKKY